jgi:preprotein translocase subunit SecF
MPLLRFIPEATNINFVGARYVAFTIDGLLLAISIVSIFWWHGFNFGIDFTGGVLMEVKAAQIVDVAKMRQEINSLGFGETQVQSYSGGECDHPVGSCVMIRVQPQAAKAGQDQNLVEQTAVSAVKTKLGASYNFRRTDVVGPKVSQELLHDGVIATLLAIFMIAIYVSVRFEWQYGIGAAVATGHDVLVTAGLFSVFSHYLDFNLTAIAALLTLAGYSINDTVVVFDRIRENRRKYKRMNLADLINLSTNQMVTRTVLTSTATALSLLPLYFFGGPALFDFSAPILFGIVVGTFSSIYVAAALLLYLPAPAGSIEGPAEPATA